MPGERQAARTFRDLVVWRKAHEFVLAEDLRYGQTRELMNSLEEVSRLLNSYAKAILTSDS